MIVELYSCNNTFFGEKSKRRAKMVALAMSIAARTCECNARAGPG
jgi:hypothetical protein